MPLIYKILTALLAFTGCAGLVLTGQVAPVMLVPGLALFPGYIRFLKGLPHLSKWAIGSLSIATLFLFAFDALIITGDMFIAVAHLTIVFQAIKSFDLKEPWDHLQVYFMSLLQLIIASELTRSAAFGVVFIIFLVALVTAMVISHFLKEGTIKKISLKWPVITISVLTLVMTGIFFISAPRAKGGFGGKTFKKGIKTVGFSEKVNFGSFGEIKLDPTIVMRIEIPESATSPLYWRGMTLDYFDGISWKDTHTERMRLQKAGNIFILMPFSRDSAMAQKIYLEPLDSEVIFGIRTIAAIEIDSRVMLADNAGAIFAPEKTYRRLNYTAYSVSGEPAVSEDSRYIQLPGNFKKIPELAKEVTKGLRTDSEKASKIENYLKTNYRYSLITSPPAHGINPIDDFLFNTKQGYCEHYATSMVLMLRAVGIPSRIVTGFINGDKNQYGGYIIVRQSDAHSWVEAVIDEKWKRFDPTPPAPLPEIPSVLYMYIDSLRMQWYRYVVNFSTTDQKKLLEFISMPFIKIPEMPRVKVRGIRPSAYAAIIIIGVTMIIFFLSRLKIYRYDFVTANYLKFRNSLKRKGAKITKASTPSDVMREAFRLGMGNEAAEFIKLYEMARFGGREMNYEEKKKYNAMP